MVVIIAPSLVPVEKISLIKVLLILRTLFPVAQPSVCMASVIQGGGSGIPSTCAEKPFSSFLKTASGESLWASP